MLCTHAFVVIVAHVHTTNSVCVSSPMLVCVLLTLFMAFIFATHEIFASWNTTQRMYVGKYVTFYV